MMCFVHFFHHRLQSLKVEQTAKKFDYYIRIGFLKLDVVRLDIARF